MKGKKLVLALMLSLGVGALWTPQAALAETSAWDGSMSRLDKGKGTADDPFLITSAEELAYLIQNYDYNSGINYRKFYKLTADLDMRAAQWTFSSSTSDNRSFRAHFDGNGHKISNIEIMIGESPKETFYGLFPQLGGDEEFESVIENLEIDGIHFIRSNGSSSANYNFRIGGLVGQQYANSRISNCIVRGFQFIDYGEDVNLRQNERIVANPLVGEVQYKFGDNNPNAKVRSAMMEGCFGKGEADLSRFHGNEGQVKALSTQGIESPGDSFSYNGYYWNKLGDDEYSFNLFDANIVAVQGDDKFYYEALFDRQKNHNYSYVWTLNGKELSSTGASVRVVPAPYKQRLSLTIYDNGHEASSCATLIEPDFYSLSCGEIVTIGQSYNVTAKVSANSGVDVNESDFIYSWQDINDNYKEVGTTATLTGATDGHSYLLVAQHRDYRNAKISMIHSFDHPIYVCNRGIDEFSASNYTLDGKSYAVGNDVNNGQTPETAVRTLRRAYDLLRTKQQGGTMSSNIIVIMGDYADHNFSEYLDNECTRRNPGYFEKDRPAMIVGRYGNFRNGRVLVAGESVKLMADTRFEQITVHGTSFEVQDPTDVAKIFACGNNLTMGYGVMINGYRNMDFSQGTPDGTFAPSISIYGGRLNNDETRYKAIENTIAIYSGSYGRIIAGDGNTVFVKKTGNVSGTPDKPLTTHIICDAANAYDPYHSQYDVAVIVGGQADGSIFANTTIDVKGDTRVGRIIGGNLGYGRKSADYPSDSFFGQTVINIMGGIVDDIFGTNVARYGLIADASKQSDDSCVTYFYGKSVINITGGVVRSTIYAAGAADVAGFAYDSKHHTYDAHIPYMKGKSVAYGSYSEANGKLPVVACAGGNVNLAKTELHLNIGGDSHLLGTIYGGGHSFSSLLPTHNAGSQVGNVYGDSYINVTGGVIDGFIYGGSRGNLSYFENADNSGYPVGKNSVYFTQMALLYGSTNVSVTGGEVKGLVYGGGEGTYYRATSSTDATNIVDALGGVYGKTNVYVGGDAVMHDYIFGAGNYADVLRTGLEANPSEAGSTNVTIAGGQLHNSIFGAGHGDHDSANAKRSIYSHVEGDTHVTVTGGTFVCSDAQPRYIKERFYGVCGGGISTSTVGGNTYVTIKHNLLTDEFVNSCNCKNTGYTAGGYGIETEVNGGAHLILETSAGGMKFDNLYGGGIQGDINGNTELTISGDIEVINLYGGCKNGNISGNSSITVLGGRIHNLFGGSYKGNIGGETFVTIGALDDPQGTNSKIYVGNVYGGNDLTGVVGKNGEGLGTHIYIYGGRIGNVYGAGNGLREDKSVIKGRTLVEKIKSAAAKEVAQTKINAMARPHVAATWISISGTEQSPAIVEGSLYGGGNNTTVGTFVRAKNDRSQYGMLREDLVANSGSININIGSHVRIGNLVMGSNGEHLFDFIPSYTTDGRKWIRGFENQEDFEVFCHSVDVSCVPVLTFNADRQFHNNHPIDDRMNRQVYFDTPDEMNSVDVVLGSFVGGGNLGSMTGDSLYQYTLPSGVLVEKEIVGGSRNSVIEYTEKEGEEAGVVRRLVGGMKPYRNVEVAIHEQRTQLNIFCQFAPVHEENGQYKGANIYGGCLDKGVVVGVSVVNLHSDLLGGFTPASGSLRDIANSWDNDCGQIYGGGKGVETEAIGNTYVNLKGAVFNGQKCIPNLFHAFGGGKAGNVIGRSNVYCDFQSPLATPMDAVRNCVWGNIYGGGLKGDIVRRSRLMPNVEEARENGTHVRVWSGQIEQVFGGSRIGNVEGASFVDIEDRGENHYHTIIRSVYGGNDLSGRIGLGTVPAMVEGNQPVTANTYVLIREQKKSDGSYLGFPVIAEVFGGGNGNYGVHGDGNTYKSGSIRFDRDTNVDLAGLEYPNVDSTYVEVRGGSVWNLYGGSNNSLVNESAVIRIDYNQGNASTRCCYDGTQSAECYERGEYMNKLLGNYGGSEVSGNKITALYNVVNVFGGNKQAPLCIQPTWMLGEAKIHNLYGGCNLGDVYYYSNDKKSGASELGLQLKLDSENLDVDNVFGGCRLGSVQACNNYLSGGVYHHDPINLKDSEFGTAIHVVNGKYGRIFGGNDISGNVLSGTRIQIEGGMVGEVYGAGNGEYVYQYTDQVDHVDAVFDEELQQYVCLVPAQKQFGGKWATSFQKVKAIEAARPNISKSYIEVAGGMDKSGKRRMAYITGAIYAGGNCATIVDASGKPGDIRLDVGDYCVINNLYLGSNGTKLIDDSYIGNIIKYNDILPQDLDKKEKGRTLLDYYMDAVTVHGLPRDFQLRKNYEKCYIGSFFMGGARGSISAHGSLAVTFPQSLTVFGKIVGGSDRGGVDVTVREKTYHHEGGILWDGVGQKPQINLTVQSKFIDADMIADQKFASANYLVEKPNASSDTKVYPGCFGSGKIDGEVNVDLQTEE